MYSSHSSLKIFGIFVLVSYLAFESQSAGAISLEFVPSNQPVIVGNQAIVEIFAANPDGTLIGEYDFFVNYDPNILTLDDVLFGSALGGDPDFQVDSESPDGTVNVSELSLVTDLTTFQNGAEDVLLFTMVFDSDMLGISPLTFSEGIAGVAGGFLGDENGVAIMLDSVATGSINVVPVPGAIWLMGSGLLALYGFKSRRSSANAG